ncbi:MAG: hypothetical protein LV481_11345 [Methylacidiphilales bacterium]|nr:hypothetical protein [Candidatus Methylacidiphilales bacterium]
MRTFLLLLALGFLPVLAEDWTATDGTVYKDVQLVKLNTDSITITDSEGNATIPFSVLPPALQKRFGYVPPLDRMKVVASWTSITTAYGKVIPITKVTEVDAHSVHYETANGAGSVEIADLPDDVQKSLGYDPDAAAKAVADEKAREAATDAMIAQVTAVDKAAKKLADENGQNTTPDSTNSSPSATLQSQITSLQNQIAILQTDAQTQDAEELAAYNSTSNIFYNSQGQLEHRQALGISQQAHDDRAQIQALQSQIDELQARLKKLLSM